MALLSSAPGQGLLRRRARGVSVGILGPEELLGDVSGVATADALTRHMTQNSEAGTPRHHDQGQYRSARTETIRMDDSRQVQKSSSSSQSGEMDNDWRKGELEPVDGKLMTIVAGIGIVINIALAFILGPENHVHLMDDGHSHLE